MNPNKGFELLAPYITDNKKRLIAEKLETRTRHLTLLMEDIYQPHNASAVLRSAECFGLQDVHIIEDRNTYEVSRHVTRGAVKWLSLRKHFQAANPTQEAMDALRSQGYRIVAATPHTGSFTPANLDLSQKTAIVIGTEKAGISPLVMSRADAFVSIPTVGFTESLNLSVAAAIIISELTTRLRISDIAWQLSEREKDELRFLWAQLVVKSSDQLLRSAQF